uniref:Beta-carotene isomerase D27-like C-terminal domain-containing protein n=1 Tax=Ananas comosus var. bracteatus TaxID=296719 RepID=A0A6V7NH01_ANACO|nr:unnamed protein product [Ananas comosus var. bracteatus]
MGSSNFGAAKLMRNKGMQELVAMNFIKCGHQIIKSGAVTTLGRGGSDLTATTIGKALGLREIQFRKLFPPTRWAAEFNAALTVPFFHWLIGPSEVVEVEVNGVKQRSGVHIKKCSGCAGMCVNMCKIPTQDFFTNEFGLPLTMNPICLDESLPGYHLHPGDGKLAEERYYLVLMLSIMYSALNRMDSDESNTVNRGRGKNKRPWKEMEDEILVQCLKELAADLHWKGENGFRNGYFGRLEKMIVEKLPGCDARVCQRIMGMPFPHLDVLAEIYGKDRANGEGVEIFVDAVHNIENEEANPMLAYIEGGGPNVGDDDNENETQSAERVASSSSRKAKKHKSGKEKEAKDPLQEQVELFSRTLGLFISRMETHFATMANVMTRE